MEHKLIMENWRRYKEKESLSESAQRGAYVATSVYGTAEEGGAVKELAEAMIELAVIFLAEPGKVMNSKAWPILQRYLGQTVVKYKRFTLTPKALKSAKRKVWADFISTPGIKDKLLKVFSNKKTIGVLLQKLFNTIAPYFGAGLKKFSVAYMAYEVFQMSFGLTSMAMKRLGYSTVGDELGNLDWTDVIKLASAALNPLKDDPARAVDHKGHEEAMRYTTENFDKWDEETQVGWCVRNSNKNAPDDFEGELTCQVVLQNADPKLIQKAKIAQSSGKSDEKLAMSVPAL